eukprot:TRINITY_DN9551_c0_g2_i3.p3 TRINITY_DN9551_c0_g2~~TRINITY_DN9551_c0_g2_i3.p3  ORF type:complete len:112 (-),score=15.61 TRINITY_DN9551_c0_g2_i3:556-891(-)
MQRACVRVRCGSSKAFSPVEEQAVVHQRLAKDQLRLAVRSSFRGARTSVDQRGEIAEALAEVEQYGGAIDEALLQGRWKLIYTTAPDVVGLLIPKAYFPLELVRIEDIYQE